MLKIIFLKTEVNRASHKWKGFQLANIQSRAVGQEAPREKQDGACKTRSPRGVPLHTRKAPSEQCCRWWLTPGPWDWEHRAGWLPAACMGRPPWDDGSQLVFQQKSGQHHWQGAQGSGPALSWGQSQFPLQGLCELPLLGLVSLSTTWPLCSSSLKLAGAA